MSRTRRRRRTRGRRFCGLSRNRLSRRRKRRLSRRRKRRLRHMHRPRRARRSWNDGNAVRRVHGKLRGRSRFGWHGGCCRARTQLSAGQQSTKRAPTTYLESHPFVLPCPSRARSFGWSVRAPGRLFGTRRLPLVYAGGSRSARGRFGLMEKCDPSQRYLTQSAARALGPVRESAKLARSEPCALPVARPPARTARGRTQQ